MDKRALSRRPRSHPLAAGEQRAPAIRGAGARRQLLTTTLVMFAALAAPTMVRADHQHDGGGSRPIGAVYVAGNEYGGNVILAFDRYADGSLGPAGPGVPTGGRGSGPGLLLPDDPIGSQGSLVVDQEHRLLFAVNAGSDDVSVFRIDRDGPTLVDRKPTGGAFPVSLAFDHQILFVLNAVGNSVTGFGVGAGGHLTPRQTCALPALPAGADPLLPGDATHSAQPVVTQTAGQLGFSPDGKKLVVVSKEGPLLQGFPFGATLGSGRIHVYDVDGRTGTLANCASPKTTLLPGNGDGKGKFPFDFAWSQQGQLLLTEIFGVATSLTGSAVSSFALDRDGALTPISTSVGNGQPAVCWIVRSGKNVFTPNFLGNNISSYRVTSKGQLTLTAAEAARIDVGDTPGQSPIDVAVTADGRFIYQLATGSAQVWPFAVSASGALTPLTPVADGRSPHSGQAGIATFDFDQDN